MIDKIIMYVFVPHYLTSFVREADEVGSLWKVRVLVLSCKSTIGPDDLVLNDQIVHCHHLGSSEPRESIHSLDAVSLPGLSERGVSLTE